jgi:hypothetical protein
VPGALLEDVEGALGDLLVAGVAGSPEPALARLRHLEGRCRDGGLIWPADVLGDLAAQCAAYAAHDARFSPLRVAELVGELCVRLDAIRAETGAVPPLFVRGGGADRPAAVGPARLIGLGCGAHPRRGGVEIAAYLQESDSGRVLAVRRDFPDPPPGDNEAPADFWRLAQVPFARGVSLGAMGGGQVLVQGGWRTSGAEYLPARARLVLNPQAYSWEQLRAPTLAQDFAEVTAHLAALPPPALRPRRIADDLCALPVAAVEGARFESAGQTVQATLRDAEGGAALLRHPFLSRAREGAEALLRLLTAYPAAVRFVSGRVQRRAGSLVVAPVAVVYEAEGRRRMLQPWIEGGAGPQEEHLPAASEMVDGRQAGPGQEVDPLAAHLADLEAALGETLLLGLHQAGADQARVWRALQRRTAALGLNRLGETLEGLAGALEGKAGDLRWEPAPAIRAALELAALLQIATTVYAEEGVVPSRAGR